MNAETLNIKMKLDMGDILADVRKLKSQLSGMVGSIQQSLPKIGTESKKAKNALSGVTKASKEVEKALDDVGDEAQESLSTVSKQSNKLAQALASIGFSVAAVKAGMKTDDVTSSTDKTVDSMSQLEDVLGSIQSMSFTGLAGSLAILLSKPQQKASELKAELDKINKAIADFDIQTATLDDWNEYSENIKKSATLTSEYTSAVKAARVASIAFKAALIALAAVLATVVAVINTLKISELGAEIYNGAQRVGMSAQAYQEWTYVLQRAGIEASELTEIVKTLTEAHVEVINGTEDVTQAFEKLGMSASEVAGMGQDELWSATISALQNVENVTERTAIAYKIFGEDASKLTTILNLSNAETQKLIATYNQLGGAMSKELIHNSSVLQGSITNLKVAWQGLRNTLAQWVIPAVITVVNWITKAIVVVNVFLQKFFNLDLTPATESLAGGITGTTGAINGYEDAITGATKAVEKLKKTQMGFDELNIVSNPSTSSGSSGGGAGGVGGSGLGSMAGFGSSVFTEASKQAEEFEKKVMEFMDKWGWAIKAIGIALAGLTLRKLLIQLASAIGYGEKLASILSFSTLKSVIAKVASSFGTFFTALKGGSGIIAAFSTAFPQIAAAFASVGSAVSSAMGVIAPAIAALGGGSLVAGIAVVVAAIAGIVSVLMYVKNNWNELTVAVKEFFAENIEPKLKNIEKNLKELIPQEVLDALAAVWQGIKNVVAAVVEWFKTNDILEKIGDAFEFIGGIIFNILAGVIAGAIESVITWIDGFVGVITGLKKIVEGAFDFIVAVFQGDLPKAKKALETFFSGASTLIKGWYDSSIGTMVNFVKGIIDWFAKLYPSIEKVWTKIKNMFSKVGTAIATGISSSIKAAINSVFTKVGEKVNTFIGWINGAVDIINQIPGVNIGRISKLNVPQLATGGIVTSSTLVNIGERGAEAVLPLTGANGSAWMDMLASKINAKGAGSEPVHVHLNVDGTELGYVVIRNINSITKQTGGLQLAL